MWVEELNNKKGHNNEGGRNKLYIKRGDLRQDCHPRRVIDLASVIYERPEQKEQSDVHLIISIIYQRKHTSQKAKRLQPWRREEMELT